VLIKVKTAELEKSRLSLVNEGSLVIKEKKTNSKKHKTFGAHTHEVYISENRMPSSVDRRIAIVCNQGINGVEMRGIIPQVVLMPIGRPQDTEVLNLIVNPGQDNTVD